MKAPRWSVDVLSPTRLQRPQDEAAAVVVVVVVGGVLLAGRRADGSRSLNAEPYPVRE
jgi:hypothetical protein